MLFRHGQRPFSALTAFLAVVAMLVFSFSAPGNHAPSLHLQGIETAVGKHSIDHGDHTHDEFDVTETDDWGSGHHHADHSHEKIDLAAAAGVSVRLSSAPKYLARTSNLADGLSYGIERPPRAVILL